MAALAFPQSPSVNDVFTSAGRSWKWTGTRWVGQPQPISPSRLSGEGAEIGDVLTFDGENYSPVPLANSKTLARSAWASPYHYYGTAPTGTAESATGWDIARIEVSSAGSTTTLNATGAWSNRASLSYS